MDQDEAAEVIPGLTFDPGPHEYRYNGEVVPSVTQLLAPMESWNFLDDESLAWYAARGQAVHLATSLDDSGDLDEETIDPQIAPYLESWRALRRDATLEVLSTEEQVYHTLFQVAGTLDRRMKIKGRHAVVDLKAGVKLNSHGVQVAAYRKLWNFRNQPTEHVKDTYTCYLQNDGSQAKLVKWDDPLHDQMFIALCTQRTWRTRYAK